MILNLLHKRHSTEDVQCHVQTQFTRNKRSVPLRSIPNFKGAAAAAHSLAALDDFRQAKVVKVNPDKPQETVRFLALEVRELVRSSYPSDL